MFEVDCVQVYSCWSTESKRSLHASRAGSAREITFFIGLELVRIEFVGDFPYQGDVIKGLWAI